jgi:hypothetical protein
MEQGIKLVLDLIGMEPEEGPTDQLAWPEAIVEKGENSWPGSNSTSTMLASTWPPTC